MKKFAQGPETFKVIYAETTNSDKEAGIRAPKEKHMVPGITVWRSKDF